MYIVRTILYDKRHISELFSIKNISFALILQWKYDENYMVTTKKCDETIFILIHKAIDTIEILKIECLSLSLCVTFRSPRRGKKKFPIMHSIALIVLGIQKKLFHHILCGHPVYLYISSCLTFF